MATYTVLFTLLVAAAEHLSRPAALVGALAAHRMLPAPAAVAALVIAVEALLAVGGIVALLQDGGARLLTAVLLGSAALLGLYAGYGLRLISAGRPGSCGCSRMELPMTGWVVGRAAVLAGLALAALVLPDPAGTPGRAELAVVLLAAATFTALLWHLPAAMYQPVPATAGPPPHHRTVGSTEGGMSG
ncbi:MauE/DoxX family redox-associated membrane protein [Micromonospora sp. CPCC 205561]|uniref:MauE/DoxX family redox-associated membrane protein n=1 Tax=Micromonospora sp. CPCC 205561 TaxID=3122407 RepID=UPI002FEF2A9D